MPYSRATGRRRFQRTSRYNRGRNTRVGAPAGRRPRMTYRRRVNQNLVRQVQWFKRVQAITSDTAGNIGFATDSTNVGNVDDFVTFGTLYSQFKVLKVVCKFFPANVGGESQQIITAGPGQGFPLLQRGDCLSYTGKQSALTSIPDLINRSSARLLQPRKYHKRWVDRPKGYPQWGELSNTGGVTTDDPWDDESGIHMIGENFTPTQAPGQQNYFYVMTLWKVMFRSRQE